MKVSCGLIHRVLSAVKVVDKSSPQPPGYVHLAKCGVSMQAGAVLGSFYATLERNYSRSPTLLIQGLKYSYKDKGTGSKVPMLLLFPGT